MGGHGNSDPPWTGARAMARWRGCVQVHYVYAFLRQRGTRRQRAAAALAGRLEAETHGLATSVLSVPPPLPPPSRRRPRPPPSPPPAPSSSPPRPPPLALLSSASPRSPSISRSLAPSLPHPLWRAASLPIVHTPTERGRGRGRENFRFHQTLLYIAPGRAQIRRRRQRPHRVTLLYRLTLRAPCVTHYEASCWPNGGCGPAHPKKLLAGQVDAVLGQTRQALCAATGRCSSSCPRRWSLCTPTTLECSSPSPSSPTSTGLSYCPSSSASSAPPSPDAAPAPSPTTTTPTRNPAGTWPPPPRQLAATRPRRRLTPCLRQRLAHCETATW